MTRPGLEAIVAEARRCRLCREAPAAGKPPLPHEPRPVMQVSPTARLLIAGQAPGTRVHASGRPFTDPSGEGFHMSAQALSALLIGRRQRCRRSGKRAARHAAEEVAAEEEDGNCNEQDDGNRHKYPPSVDGLCRHDRSFYHEQWPEKNGAAVVGCPRI